MTQKELKRLVRVGAAKDITHSSSRAAIPEEYSQVGSILPVCTDATECCSVVTAESCMLFAQELRLSGFSAKITGKRMVRLLVSIINQNTEI